VAQKIQTLFIDDLDGSEAEGTVRFGLDGTEYEIDLNAQHAQALRKALAQYVAAARRAAGTRRSSPSRRRASASGHDSTEVRDWAKAQGIDVKDRGRIPAELIVKFKAASGKLKHTALWAGPVSDELAEVGQVDPGRPPGLLGLLGRCAGSRSGDGRKVRHAQRLFRVVPAARVCAI
jgi:hypothetical protein